MTTMTINIDNVPVSTLANNPLLTAPITLHLSTRILKIVVLSGFLSFYLSLKSENGLKSDLKR